MFYDWPVEGLAGCMVDSQSIWKNGANSNGRKIDRNIEYETTML
jgi:hypothetical protein